MSEATHTGKNSNRNCTFTKDTKGRQTQTIESYDVYQESRVYEDAIHQDSGLNEDDSDKSLDSCHNTNEGDIEQPAIFLKTQTTEMNENTIGSIEQLSSTAEEEAESTGVQVPRDDIENLLAQQRNDIFQSVKVCHYQRHLNAMKAEKQYYEKH